MSRSEPVDARPRSWDSRRARLAGGAVTVAASLGLLVVLPAALWASGGGGHGETHHAPSVADLLFPVLNFSLYLVVIIKYVIPAIRQYLSQRHEQIRTSASEAQLALREAETAAAAAGTRLKNIDAECAGLRDDMVNAATRRGEDGRADAQATGERRLRDAGLLAEQERRRAFGAVRTDIAALAASLAEDRIRAALGPDDQRAFLDQFLQEAAQQ